MTEETTWKPLKAHRKIAMSGTPLVNKPIEIWAVLNWLDPKNWPSYYWFAKRYCGGHQSRFGFVADGATNLEELNRRLRSTVMLRRTKAEVLKDLPPKFRQVIEFEVPSASGLVRKENQAVEESRKGVATLRAAVELAKINKDDTEYKRAVKALTDYYRQAQAHIAKIRHDLAVAKVPYVVDHLRNALMEDGKKIVVFAHHRRVINSIYNQLQANGYNPVKLMGGMSQAEKNDAVKRFQNDQGVRIFVGGLTAAGVGLTLTASSHVVFAELDWVPGNVTQCEDRCHRIGQSDNVLIQHLVAYGSLDARIAKRLIEKQEILDTVLSTGAVDSFEPIDWLSDHQEDRALQISINVLDDTPPTQYNTVVDGYGLKRIVDNPNDYGVSDSDLIIASRLVKNPELTGRAAVYAQALVDKYLRNGGK